MTLPSRATPVTLSQIVADIVPGQRFFEERVPVGVGSSGWYAPRVILVIRSSGLWAQLASSAGPACRWRS